MEFAHFIILLPLFSSIVLGLNLRLITKRQSQLLTSILMFIVFALSCIVFYRVVINYEIIDIVLLKWLDLGYGITNWQIHIDQLTALMLVVVCFVSLLVHIYSIGYMDHDEHPQRFMCYLSLFTFFMLLLVASDNFAQLFVGWEGVGLCSYLLIGFWFKKNSANLASMKAFIVNRVADFAFLIGIFTIFYNFNSLNFADVLGNTSGLAKIQATTFIHWGFIKLSVLDFICLMLMIGAMGKSAQMGLHIWLPDAMEGPTPVSALIHAATMVTAGIFLIARCSFIFEHSPIVLSCIIIIGALTAIMAATIALVQTDIKKIIAYSTCSQLGYMFFACGVSAYNIAMFHLATHAFFKALLFLGAGSVIHALHDEQDITRMGGLYKKIPLTFILMLIGSLALSGIYPLAGYYSKDAILEAAYLSGSNLGTFAFYAGLIVAFLTSFYSFRLLFLVFFCRPKKELHAHESSTIMILPLVFLAIGSVAAGMIGNNVLHIADNSFWHDSIALKVESHESSIPTLIKLLPSILAITGIFLAYIFYGKRNTLQGKMNNNPIYKFFVNKWYFDQIYNFLFIKPIRFLSRFAWKSIDNRIVDGAVNGVTDLATKVFSKMLCRFQDGLVYHYAFITIAGLVLFVGFIFIA